MSRSGPALNSLGHKREIDGKDRMALGQISGGVVKLTPDEEVTLGLGIGEGIETTLSLKLMSDWGDSPIWACLSAGALELSPCLAGSRRWSSPSTTTKPEATPPARRLRAGMRPAAKP